MRNRSLLYLSAIAVCVVVRSTGCAKYATQGELMDRIEQSAPLGIQEEEFKQVVTQARLVEENGEQKVYLLVVREPCLICGDMDAFLKSYEISATRFAFKSGVLVSAERMDMNR